MRIKNQRRWKGFGYLDVICSMALLILCFLILTFGINTYQKNLYIARINQQLDSMALDEVLITRETKETTNKTKDQISIEYVLIETNIYNHKILETVELKIEDEKTKTKRAYTFTFRK